LECTPTTKGGQLLTASYMDYTMPRADDVPSYQLSTTCHGVPGNPLGMKGCGEAGAIGSPPAVINAITDALGSNDLTMPATPERVWALAQSGMKQAAE
jgi:carbon-monoxide dehydrogenase large subunit